MSKKEDPIVECALELRNFGDCYNIMYSLLGTLLVNGQTAQDSKVDTDSTKKNKTKKPNK